MSLIDANGSSKEKNVLFGMFANWRVAPDDHCAMRGPVCVAHDFITPGTSRML